VWGAQQYWTGLWEGAVKTDRPQLECSPAKRSTGLQFLDSSAIPFRFRVRQAPAWLRIGNAEIPGQHLSYVGGYITKNAPSGRHGLNVELEITNLHTGPGRNLIVRLPLQVNVRL
jgi:hypothetical protein